MSDLEARMEDLEQRVERLETGVPNEEKRIERLRVKEAIESGICDDIIEAGGHGVIEAVRAALTKKLGIPVQYGTVYYILKLK